MDVLKDVPNYEHLILCISKSNNKDLLAFYWDPLKSEADVYWVLRDGTTGAFRAMEEVSLMHKMAIQFHVRPDSSGRLEVSFSIPINTKYTLFLVQMPPGSERKFSIVFQHESKKIFTLNEIFVSLDVLEKTQCFCRCRSTLDQSELVEVVDVDLGILKAFM
jgi:hypothetical protein